VEHDFESIGERIMLLNGTRMRRDMYVTTGIADVRHASSYDVLLDTRA
jgi:hypothetical protein